MLGGISNYVLKKIQPTSESENMSKYVWGIKVGDSIYINAYPYSKRHGYNKIIEKGYYSYFIGEPAYLKEEQLKLGMIKEGDPQMWVCCRTCFVILTDGSVKWLNPELLMKLIADNSELLKQMQEKKLIQENVYEMFDFLHRYNQSKK